MENIDIIMIIQIYLPLNEYHKNKEVDDLKSLIDNLYTHKNNNDIFNWFFVGQRLTANQNR